MNLFFDFFRKLFETDSAPARFGSSSLSDFPVWFFTVSCVLLGTACLAGLIVFRHYIRKRKALSVAKIATLVSVLFLALATVYFLEAVSFWIPLYRLHTLILFVAALISWIAVILLAKSTSHILPSKSNTELEKEMLQRKLAEEKLLQSEKRFKSLVQEGGDLIGIFDKHGRYLYISPTTRILRGMDPEEFIGRSAYDFMHPDDKERVREEFDRLKTEKRVQVNAFRYRLKSGEYRWVETVLTNRLDDPAVQGIIFNSRDVTDRVKKEEIIQQRSAELNKIFDYSRDFICTIDVEGKFVRVSNASLAILGYAPAELLGKYYLDFVVEEDVAKTRQIAENILKGQPVIDFGNRYIHKEGYPVPLLWTTKWDDEDKVMYCIARNATERIRLEEAIQKEQQRFARMFTEAPLSMCILKGPQHVFEDYNELYSVLTGRKNIKGKTAREVFPELVDQGYFEWLDWVYTNGQTFSGHETPLIVDINGDGKLTERYINFIYQPYFGRDGKVEGIYYFGIDVTEQVIMRRKVEQSEKRFRSLIENSHDILVLVDAEGKRKYVSPAFERTLGYQLDEVVGQRVFDKVHPEDAATLRATVGKAKETHGLTFPFTARFRKKDSQYIWLEGGITNMLHIEAVNALVVNCKDIDERKRVEEEKDFVSNINKIFTQQIGLEHSLHEVTRELCSFLNADGAETWITSVDNKEVQLAAFFSKDKGKETSTKKILPLGKGLPGEAWKRKTNIFIDDVIKSEKCIRKEFFEANGFKNAVAIPILFNEQVTAIIIFYNHALDEERLVKLGKNILLQLASEIQRKKTEEELNRFFNLSGDLLCIAGADGYFKKVNPAFTKVLGYDEQELLSIPYLELIHPDDRLLTSEEIANVIKGKQTFNYENRYIAKDKKIKHLVWTVTPFQENLMYAVAKDVTEVRKAEKQAENYSRRISVILESITDAFFAVDKNFSITYWNKQAAKLLNVQPEKMIGKNLWESFPEAVPLKFYTEYHKAMSANQSVRFEEYFEPAKMWFDVSAYPSEEGLSVYFRDVTESKNTYQNLVRTEADVRSFARQLNSMLEEERSRIAREIHDEFGQQLAGIKMSISTFKRLLENDDAGKEKLNDIVLDIDKTMQSLRSFATELRPGILDTMGLIPSLEWLATEFEKKAGINCFTDFEISELDIERTFSTVYFRVCQEALTNILKHAQAQNVVIQVYENKGELVLQIIDDGIGIVEDKIQNPFSMGILGMKERANIIGGKLMVRRGTFGGTIVQLKAKIYAD